MILMTPFKQKSVVLCHSYRVFKFLPLFLSNIFVSLARSNPEDQQGRDCNCIRLYRNK